MNPRLYSKWSQREGFIIAYHNDNVFYHVFASEDDWQKRKSLYIFANIECLNAFITGVRYVREKESSNE